MSIINIKEEGRLVDTALIVERYKTLQRYIGWQEDDASHVRAAQTVLLPHLDPIIEDFYSTIEQFPEAVKVITGGTDQIERLKRTLHNWPVRVLTSGKRSIRSGKSGICFPRSSV